MITFDDFLLSDKVMKRHIKFCYHLLFLIQILVVYDWLYSCCSLFDYSKFTTVYQHVTSVN